MAESIDQVFVKAITTIRQLSTRSNYGSLPKPPPETRIKLYGLYKQATEGNVEGIMSRPYGNKPEDEGAKKKWDAWKNEEGLSKTEAKRKYISYLIDTMKIYGSGTLEARRLLEELEYLWDQIKDVSYSPSIGTSNLGYSIQKDLQHIYSHSRRNTAIFNDSASNFNLCLGNKNPDAYQSSSSPLNNMQEVKNWQNETNVMLNRLFNEVYNKKSLAYSSSSDDNDNYRENVKKWLFKVYQIVLKSSIKLMKHFSLNLIFILLVTILLRNKIKIKQKLIDDNEMSLKLVLNSSENKILLKLIDLLK